MTLKQGITTQFVLPYIGGCALVIFFGLSISQIQRPETVADFLTKFPFGLFGGAAAFLFLAAVTVQSILPRSAKEILVFWRLKERLPGHRAFKDESISADGRINWQTVRSYGGEPNLSATEQNNLWYRWYRSYQDHPTVIQSHRLYLAFRDLTAVAALSAPIFAIAVFWSLSVWVAILFMIFPVLAYTMFMIVARNKAYDMMAQVLVMKSSEPD